MSCFIIPPDQCILDDKTKYFICVICNNLTQGYLIHDGGFGQEYCQRAFCGTCISAYSSNANKKVINKSGTWRVDCPIDGCTANFKQPMFREPSETEEEFYNKIKVKCQSCRAFFNPQSYIKHLAGCLSRFAVGCSPSGKEGEKVAEKGTHEKRIEAEEVQKHFISFNGTTDNEKYVYGNIKKAPNCLVLKLFYENKMHRVQLSPGMDTGVLMSKLGSVLGTKEELKMVCIKHRSLKQSGSLQNFLRRLPICAPVNLTPFRPNVADCDKYLCLYKL